jgi:hypothetical protein
MKDDAYAEILELFSLLKSLKSSSNSVKWKNINNWEEYFQRTRKNLKPLVEHVNATLTKEYLVTLTDNLGEKLDDFFGIVDNLMYHYTCELNLNIGLLENAIYKIMKNGKTP